MKKQRYENSNKNTNMDKFIMKKKLSIKILKDLELMIVFIKIASTYVKSFKIRSMMLKIIQ